MPLTAAGVASPWKTNRSSERLHLDLARAGVRREADARVRVCEPAGRPVANRIRGLYQLTEDIAAANSL